MKYKFFKAHTFVDDVPLQREKPTSFTYQKQIKNFY